MTKYTELASITRIMLEKDLDQHRKSLDQSRQIAGELAQIDAMRAAAQADAGAISARQMLGADTLWQGWLLRKRADIQRRAAQARAQEMQTLAVARVAFSRTQAAENLVEQARTENLRKRQLAEADTIDALGQLRRMVDSDQ
ncbi:hypothetical protein J4E08_04505 [Sagittula sp. NFXS13]|uniref:Flagellar FliJ protein n=1 Tax=Sagittula marina TaxID=943940 RepID=A0A7W6GS36_9RHOB|nr:hypothetical protein [Sagittula marina]MBB3983719.1 hypothetical protein [Sagittula marina]